MRTTCWLWLLGLTISPLWAQDKAAFDLDRESSNAGLLALKKEMTPLGTMTEFTLLPGGYLTIGTESGLSESPLDDRCGISFGHPYALTSYPLLAVDGDWGKPDEYFAAAWETPPTIAGDTLKIDLQKSGISAMSFYLLAKAGGATIEIGMRLKNLDVVAHALAAGLVFDPALGKWGDGYAFTPPQSAAVTEATLLQDQQVPQQLEIWEREQRTRGMGIQLAFGTSRPQNLILANWKDLYDDPTPAFTPGVLKSLYDLTLKMAWEEKQIAPGEETGFAVELSLLPPVFSPVFLRWDLPLFLSLENNLLFPRNFPVTIQAADFSNPPVSGATLALQLPYEIEGDATAKAMAFSIENFAYQTRQLASREIFEDRIVSVSVTCEKGGVFLDRISRNVFIPATPVSDTGLVVSIDTVFAGKFPEISFVFWVEIESSQQKIFNLRPENLFLYENGSRIQEFVMQKDTGEGLNEADIVFVLDVTGSMGNEIASVKNNIIEFADSLSYRGVDVRLGMVTFLDEIENVYAFTDDIQLFQQNVAAQYAHGGGDYPENSLEALLRAAQFAFRPQAQRIAIWITDASFHERDAVTSLTKEMVVDSLLAKAMTVHAIGNAAEQTAFYDPIIIPTGGNFYNINGNFRDILLDISRLKSTFRHRVTYTSPSSGIGTQQIRIEVHYAGLGGEATINYTLSGANTAKPLLVCYPNPFNPQTRIVFDNPAKSRGEVAIYNVLGQKVKEFFVSPTQRAAEIVWDARDERRLLVAAGFYLVQLRLRDESGKIQTQAIRKILYVK